MMRDEPFDAPIPDEVLPSQHSAERAIAAEAEFERIQRMSDDEIRAQRAAAIESERKSWDDYAKRTETENAIFAKMRAAVVAWQVSTPNHEGLRRFMLEQLDTSMMHLSKRSDDQSVEPLPVSELRAQMLGEAKREWEYHKEQYTEEVRRATERTEWIRALKASLAESKGAKL